MVTAKAGLTAAAHEPGAANALLIPAGLKSDSLLTALQPYVQVWRRVRKAQARGSRERWLQPGGVLLVSGDGQCGLAQKPRASTGPQDCECSNRALSQVGRGC